MKYAALCRWIVSLLMLALASTTAFRAVAQSEFLRGSGMPYEAFDRLPKTDLDVAGGNDPCRVCTWRYRAAA